VAFRSVVCGGTGAAGSFFFLDPPRAGLEEDEPEDEEDPELELLLSFAFFKVDFFGALKLARRGGASLDPDEDVLEPELDEPLAMIDNAYPPALALVKSFRENIT